LQGESAQEQKQESDSEASDIDDAKFYEEIVSDF
jgi:hypothetical protein